MSVTFPAFDVLFRLGRISNLPTVWTNTLAAMVLSGGEVFDSRFAALILAMSSFYIGGMYLNDAFDAEIDARERPERPIPAGLVSQNFVFTAGFVMLALGILILTILGATSGFLIQGMLAGLSLAAIIIAYDVYHKQNPLSPLLMGLCRVMVYFSIALAISGGINTAVLVGALLLLCYLIGLTYIAKQENLGQVENMWPLVFLAAPLIWGMFASLQFDSHLPMLIVVALAGWIVFAINFLRRRGPGDIPRAVVSLIAGISLLDAVMLANNGASVAIVFFCVAAFALTLFLQRFIAGT